MTYDNRRYLIIPTSITGSIDFTQVHETSAETLRLSVDGTKTFVKYDVNVVDGVVYGRPSIYSNSYTEYTHEQILTVLATEEWTASII